MQVVSRPTDVMAVVFAFAAFAVVLIAGASAGRPALDTIVMAIVAMLAARVGGQVLGAAAEVAIREHVREHEARHPIPDTSVIDIPVVDEAPPSDRRAAA